MKQISKELNQIFQNVEIGIGIIRNDKIEFTNKKFNEFYKTQLDGVLSCTLNSKIMDIKLFQIHNYAGTDGSGTDLN